MNPAQFPEANIQFVAPPDLHEEQVRPIAGYRGAVRGGSLDGSPICVVAWQPTNEEIQLMTQGQPIFLTFVGGIPPHYLSLSFKKATHPA